MSSTYTRYLVCYDIADNRKRKKYADALKDLGLIPIQKSVFYGDLKPPESRLLSEITWDMSDADEDKCLWFPCHLSPDRIRACLGLSQFTYDPPDCNKLI